MNIGELIGKIQQMREEAKRQKRELITKITFIAEGHSKEETPVDTGNLRRSENSRIVSDEEGRVGTNVEYARWVHDGTARSAPNPYFTRGLERTRPEVEPLLKAAGEKITGAVGG